MESVVLLTFFSSWKLLIYQLLIVGLLSIGLALFLLIRGRYLEKNKKGVTN